DVARGTREPRPKRGGLSVLVSGYGVELRAVPAGAVDGRDLASVVEERVRVLDLRLETELIRDVRLGVAVVVDVNCVQDVVAELEEVGPTVGAFQRDVVGDQGHGAGRVGAQECV